MTKKLKKKKDIDYSDVIEEANMLKNTVIDVINGFIPEINEVEESSSGRKLIKFLEKEE